MRRNNPFKRLLGLLAALALVLAMLPAAASAATPETLYLKPNANWMQAGARFAAYFFGNGEKWVSMTDTDGDGTYEVAAPAGYPKVIFCRMNPSASANNWNNKWNQTGDLTIPTDGKNLFTIPAGAWDNSTATWSTYTYAEPEFTVAGVAGLCGTEWNVEDTSNDMTKNAAGLYEKVYTNVAAGTYKFKVVQDHSWTTAAWGGTADTDGNAAVVVEKDGSTVTITFNATTKAITASVEAPPEPEPQEFTVTFSGTNLTISGAATVTEGTAYTATLTADEGFILPQTITVTVGGAEAAHTYDAATGTVTVENVTGDVVITAVAEEEPEPWNGIISEVESQETWFSANGLTLHNTGAPAGSAWLEVTEPVGYPVVINAITPFDMSAYAEGYLHMWIYVADASVVTDGFVEFSSAGTTDNSELAWPMTGMGLINGWNEVYLSVKDAIRTDGTTGPVDLTNINFIRIYTGSGTPHTFGFDKMEMTMTKPVLDKVVSQVEGMDGWYAMEGVALQEGNAAVGDKWIQVGQDHGAAHWTSAASGLTPVDITPYKYLRLRIFMPDVSALNESRVELSSAAMPGSSEISWYLANYGGLLPGWNDVYLPIAEGVYEDGATGRIDLTQVNYIHLYLLTTKGQFGIDQIELTNTDPAEKTELMLEPITGIHSWYGSAMTYETTGGYAEGAGWLKTQTSSDNIVYMRNWPATDISAFANGYLNLKLYVEDAATVNPYSMIEIASIWGVDNQELYWEARNMNLQSGWNDLYLPLNQATAQGAEAFNPAAFQTIRIVGMPMGTLVMGVDEIKLTNTKPVVDYVIRPVEKTDSENWFSTQGLTLHTEGAPSGNAWIEISTADGYPVVINGLGGATVDISDFAEGYLHTWIYVPNAAGVIDGFIELSSSGTTDNSEISWAMTGMGLKDGWNELYLSVADAIYTDGSTGPVDLSKINFIRIYTGQIQPSTFGFDALIMTMNKVEAPEEPEPEPEPEPTEPAYKSASITLENDLSVNFKVDAANAAAAGYTDLYTVFSIHGMTFTTTGEEKDGLHVYTLRSIQPDWMGDTITAKLYGTKDGGEVLLETREYSVAQYCMTQLAEYDGEKAAQLRTLLVDLLNYGAAAQVFTGYNTDALVNAALTEEQKAWGTTADPNPVSVLALSEMDAPAAQWAGVALYLRDTTRIRLHFTSELTEGLTLKVTCGEREWIVDQADFQHSGNHYYVYFDHVSAQEMRTAFQFTVCAGDQAVSQTLTYSVASYAANATGAVKTMTDAMLCYGDSAAAYMG